jgi:AraC-like DNA-binding protein
MNLLDYSKINIMDKYSINEFIFSILHADYTVITKEWNCHYQRCDPFSRLYLIDKGKAEIEKSNTKHTLSKGNIYLLPEKLFFKHLNSPGAGHYWIHLITRNNIGLSIFDLFDTHWSIPVNDYKNAAENTKKIISLFPDKSAAATLEKQAAIRALLALFIKEPEKDLKDKNTDELNRLHTTLSFIEDNLTKPISVEDISEIAHLHPNYFSNLFRQHFGIPPMKYVLQKRIEKAQILLCSTEKPVKNIAIETGFNDPCYFTRFFSKHTGMTPIQYRMSIEIYS